MTSLEKKVIYVMGNHDMTFSEAQFNDLKNFTLAAIMFQSCCEAKGLYAEHGSFVPGDCEQNRANFPILAAQYHACEAIMTTKAIWGRTPSSCFFPTNPDMSADYETKQNAPDLNSLTSGMNRNSHTCGHNCTAGYAVRII